MEKGEPGLIMWNHPKYNYNICVLLPNLTKKKTCILQTNPKGQQTETLLYLFRYFNLTAHHITYYFYFSSWTHGVLTCSRTLAVSKGKVTRSATHPAVPAEKILTAADGARSVLPVPTMITNSAAPQNHQVKWRILMAAGSPSHRPGQKSDRLVATNWRPH